MNRAVILDLDGTLVRAFPEGETTCGPRTRDEVEILPGTREAICNLKSAGYLALAITNQPGLARGTIQPLKHRGVRLFVQSELSLWPIYLCPHDGEWCACRKPRPGLIYQAAVEHELDLSKCWLIGDRETDREAAIRAGIPQAQALKTETNHGIGEATKWILANST